MRRLILLIAALTALAAPAVAQGRLVIAGGAVAPDNAEVWGAFVQGLPDPARDRVAVIVGASAEPVASFESARSALVRHGVAAERVILIRLAAFDDPKTTEDERLWSGGGDDPREVARLAGVGGVWFTGGDQARLGALLLTSEGQARPLLQAVHDRHKAGAAVGGSSAGAAFQSRTMILRGDRSIAVLQPVAPVAPEAEMEHGRLVLAPGGGFFRFGVIDQHFDRDPRLGRLARAVVVSGEVFGFGIDENTALVVDGDQGRVAGAGTVTILRAPEAADRSGQLPFTGLNLSIVGPGARIALRSGAVLPHP